MFSMCLAQIAALSFRIIDFSSKITWSGLLYSVTFSLITASLFFDKAIRL